MQGTRSPAASRQANGSSGCTAKRFATDRTTAGSSETIRGKLGRIGEQEAWVFPSFFSEASFVDRSTVSTLACAQRVISVANLDAEARRIAITSSQGPTRDGREKPDVAAPGTNIVAANGFAGPGSLGSR